MGSTSKPRIFSRGRYAEHLRINNVPRPETVDALLLAATVVALVWANSPIADGCFNLRDFRIGPESCT